MNVEVGAEASLFPEKEYIIGNAVAVHDSYVDWGDCVRLSPHISKRGNNLPSKSGTMTCCQMRYPSFLHNLLAMHHVFNRAEILTS